MLIVVTCSEFLDKVQLEIDRKPDAATAASSCADHAPAAEGADDVIKQLFQGELISEVRS